MPNQAKILMDRLKDEALCNWDNDWKLITLFVGVSSIIELFFIFVHLNFYLG
jgi:hypothetical protein